MPDKTELIKLNHWHIKRFSIAYLTLEKAMDMEEDEIRLVPLESFDEETLGRMWFKIQEIIWRDNGVKVDKGRVYRIRP